MKKKSMEEENRRKDGGCNATHDRERAIYFHHFGVSLWVLTGFALGIALKP